MSKYPGCTKLVTSCCDIPYFGILMKCQRRNMKIWQLILASNKTRYLWNTCYEWCPLHCNTWLYLYFSLPKCSSASHIIISKLQFCVTVFLAYRIWQACFLNTAVLPDYYQYLQPGSVLLINLLLFRARLTFCWRVLKMEGNYFWGFSVHPPLA
jgi:hypothetical protein